jgi:hypothetical protein
MFINEKTVNHVGNILFLNHPQQIYTLPPQKINGNSTLILPVNHVWEVGSCMVCEKINAYSGNLLCFASFLKAIFDYLDINRVYL